MRFDWLRCIVVVAALTAVAGEVNAQRRPAARPAARSQPLSPRLGGHFGYNFDADAALLGAQATFPLARQFDLYPSFDFYFTDGYSMWGLNVDVRYRLRRAPSVYFGTGLNYTRVSVDGFGGSSTNLNFLGGVQGRTRPAVPYAEMRITVGDGSLFQLVGGVSWRI